MSAMDTIFNSESEWVEELINTSGWTADQSPYKIWIHGVDEFNNWGAFCACEITVSGPTPTGMPIPASSSGSIMLMLTLISLSICFGSLRLFIGS
jgi:hypothetical protein